MRSGGEWYRKVPKGRRENLLARKRVIAEARKNGRLRQRLLELCRQDILFYVNLFVWTYDPRTKGKMLPFVTWPFQDRAFQEILECISEGRDLVIEKSRDMGASWMSLTAMEWLWHFHAGHSFLMVSRKEDLVDAPGDPDSLFWKVDFIHRHLPDWLLPESDRRKLHFGNLDNGSTIDGESTTAASGVGGRRTAVFIDEFSRIEEGYQLLAGTADTTRCRIFNFTPFGTSNAAYRLARRGDVRKLRLHWSEHPEKARGLYRSDPQTGKLEVLDTSYAYPLGFQYVLDGRLRSPWYDGECRRRANDREVAQMLDIDYQGSAYQFFDKLLIQDLQRVYCVPPYWEGDVSFDADTAKPLGLVRVQGGPLKLWLQLDKDGKPPPGSYAGGADLSAGTGATNSCLSFADGHTGEKVLEYASPYLKPEDMAYRAVALCRFFRDGDGEGVRFVWEQQGPGLIFGKKVLELGYRNVFFRDSGGGVLPGKVSETPGWYPSNDNRRLLLDEYRAALSSRQFVNRSFAALEECLYFEVGEKGVIEHKGGDVASYDPETGRVDPTGAGVNHGDRVIADALAWKMCRGLGKLKKKDDGKEVKVGSLAWRRQLHENERREVWS